CLAPSLLNGSEEVLEPSDQRKVAELRRGLFDLKLGARAGSLDDRRAQAEALAERARVLGHDRTEARARAVQGYLAERADDAASARAHFGAVLDLGLALGDPEVAEQGWYWMGVVALEIDADPTTADWLLQRSSRALDRMGKPPRRVARVAMERGRWHMMRGERDRAEAVTREAIAVLEDAGPSAQWVLAGALRSLANVVGPDGRADEALALQDRARALEGLPEVDDPTMLRTDRGDALHTQGLNEADAGDYDQAAVTLLEALAETRRERGPHSAAAARVHLALSQVHDARGDASTSRQHAVAAEQLFRDTLGEGHPDYIAALSGLGMAEFRSGEFDRAAEHYRRALRGAEDSKDIVPPAERATHRANLGEALYRAGRLEEAEATLMRAVAELEEALDAGDPRLAVPAKALGEVSLARGDAAAAREHLRLALTVLVEHGTSPAEQAETRWSLARALHAQGEAAEARRAATTALGEMKALGPDWADRATELRAWIDAEVGDASP
ncbi:MAG: tetratricopeptide repeat protein, partial [Nannocystaceae bacterium]